MSESEDMHSHLDEDRLDEVARASLDGLSEVIGELDCPECEALVEQHARHLSLARLLRRDTRVPGGRPAVDAVRTIRRQSYRRRALEEIMAILTSTKTKAGV